MTLCLRGETSLPSLDFGVMHRREFLFSLGSVAFRQRPRLRVDGARLNDTLTELPQFGRTPEGGISRVAYSDADLDGRAYAMGLMRQAGLDVTIDFAGNILGRRPGIDSNLPPVMFGSHIDSVPHGGNYDGQVGSMAAIEIAQTLADAGVTTEHPLEVVIFQNEENGKTGSRAMAVELTDGELDQPSHTDKTLGEGIAFIGGDPGRLDEAGRRPGDIAAYLELHIEQGSDPVRAVHRHRDRRRHRRHQALERDPSEAARTTRAPRPWASVETRC